MQEYWKTKLSPSQRGCYEDMVSAFSKYKEHVICDGFAPHEISETYVAINNDHPELYQLPYNPQVARSFGTLGCNTELVIHNIYNRLQIRKINAEIDGVKSNLLTCIPTNASEYEKENAVCDYILQHTTYEINNQFNQNAASVLVWNKGQCSGIAKAVKLMLGWIGIEAIIVNGNASDKTTGMNGPHSWNIVWIDGKSYHLDATFMLGANLNKCKPFRYPYLNYTDEEIAINHQWDRKSTPHCNTQWGFREQQIQIGNTIESDRPTKTISSLYEFKQELRAAILAGDRSFNFCSQIPMSESDFMRNISNACKTVLDSIGKVLTMSITIKNNMVFIRW